MRARPSHRRVGEVLAQRRAVAELADEVLHDAAQGEPLLECHLIDFAGDLYGEAVKVRFAERLRGEVRFESVDDLVAQMGLDVEATRELVS